MRKYFVCYDISSDGIPHFEIHYRGEDGFEKILQDNLVKEIEVIKMCKYYNELLKSQLKRRGE